MSTDPYRRMAAMVAGKQEPLVSKSDRQRAKTAFWDAYAVIASIPGNEAMQGIHRSEPDGLEQAVVDTALPPVPQPDSEDPFSVRVTFTDRVPGARERTFTVTGWDTPDGALVLYRARHKVAEYPAGTWAGVRREDDGGTAP